MLQQIDIYTKATDISGLYSDLSVKIHGYIMSRISNDYAAELHGGTVNPFSIYTVDAGEYYITRVSALNEHAQQILNVFEDCRKIRIFGTDSNLELLDVRKSPCVELPQLVLLMNKFRYRISIVTPAMFRQGGVLKCVPELPAYFNSVCQKLEKFENISFTRDELYSAFSLLKVENYSLQSESFISGSRKQNGMTGFFDIKLPDSKPESDLLKTVLSYATYSGIGGQTTQGMGGFIVERR